MAYKLEITAFERSPADPNQDKVGICVGFTATAENGRFIYRSNVVSLDAAQGLSDDEIVNLAWIVVGPGIEAEMEVLGAKSAMLGQTWEPSAEAKAAVTAAIESIAAPVAELVKE